MMLEEKGWRVVRAGGSLGEADLVCLKKGKCVLLQIKSTKKKTLYYYGYMNDKLEDIPFYLVVDFSYGNIRVLTPKSKVVGADGISFDDFTKG